MVRLLLQRRRHRRERDPDREAGERQDRNLWPESVGAACVRFNYDEYENSGQDNFLGHHE